MDPRLADESTTPPTPSSYWVLPSRLLAGAYPGHQDPAAHRTRIHTQDQRALWEALAR